MNLSKLSLFSSLQSYICRILPKFVFHVEGILDLSPTDISIFITRVKDIRKKSQIKNINQS